ncbi:XRE family transcriptional regulator [Gordonia sp. NPDC003376]
MSTAHIGDPGAYTVIDGLRTPAADDSDGPTIDAMARADGVTLVRIGFRAGEVMADHRAVHPILLLGQTGEVDVAIGDGHVALSPGMAVHIAAQVTHALTALTDAVVTLMVLTPRK